MIVGMGQGRRRIGLAVSVWRSKTTNTNLSSNMDTPGTSKINEAEEDGEVVGEVVVVR